MYMILMSATITYILFIIMINSQIIYMFRSGDLAVHFNVSTFLIRNQISVLFLEWTSVLSCRNFWFSKARNSAIGKNDFLIHVSLLVKSFYLKRIQLNTYHCKASSNWCLENAISHSINHAKSTSISLVCSNSMLFLRKKICPLFVPGHDLLAAGGHKIFAYS